MYGSDFCNDVFSALNMEPSLDEWDRNELRRKASRALSYFRSYITNEVKEVFIRKSYEQGFVLCGCYSICYLIKCISNYEGLLTPAGR